MLTLPLVLVWLTIQFYTVGTIYTNANMKSSLLKTLLVGTFKHFASLLSLGDAKFSGYTIRSLLKWFPGNFADLPGYLEQYTSRDDSTCESLWLSKNLRDSDSPILLYFHGGCFALQMSPNQMMSLVNIYRAYKEQFGVEISILLVDYSLTSNGNAYPTQINEANEIYDKLVADGYTNIVVVGDSAGGNLVVNNLTHLLSISRSKKVVWPKGCVAISPYLNISKSENSGSFRRYLGYDILSHSMLKYFGNAYINGDEWLNQSSMVNMELNMHKVDWDKIPVIKGGDLLVIFGDHEVLADEILRWCEKIGLTTSHPERVAIDIDGVHIGVFLNEVIAYGSLEEWSQQFCSRTILDFLHLKFT